jgi:ABC-type transport system involved in multi-copper enzyme maturation permease subunit
MLLWKEWKENLWKLCFCAAASIAFTAMLFRIRITPDLANCVAISIIQMFAVPIVYALDIFSGEMHNRTIHLLFKIPAPRRLIFFSKYVTSAGGILLIFVVTGLLMESMSRGREALPFYLLRINWCSAIAAVVLFTWFCAFGCQCRTEAASLVAIFAVFIAWAIVFFWATMCQVHWACHITPYYLVRITVPVSPWTILGQVPGFALVLYIACGRYADIRRYL